MGLLGRALKDTFSDASIVWRSPLLALVTVTGIGAAFSLGYAFALQDYVAEGGDEHPEVDASYVWYGLKFAIAVLILSIPAYVLTGSLAMPSLLDVGAAGLDGLDVGAAWAAATGQLLTYVLLMSVWALALTAMMPALMTSFVERGGRLLSALDPIGAWGVVRRDPGAYAAALGLAGIWLATTIAIYAPVARLSPLESTAPWLVVTFLLLPLGMSFLLALQRLTGLARRARAEVDAARPHGWEHLEQQGESPQATGDVTA